MGNHIDGTIGKPRLWVTRNACKKARGNDVVGHRVPTLKQHTIIIFYSRVRPRYKAKESHVGYNKGTYVDGVAGIHIEGYKGIS